MVLFKHYYLELNYSMNGACKTIKLYKVFSCNDSEHSFTEKGTSSN
jgi:hypothetical protein